LNAYLFSLIIVQKFAVEAQQKCWDYLQVIWTLCSFYHLLMLFIKSLTHIKYERFICLNFEEGKLWLKEDFENKSRKIKYHCFWHRIIGSKALWRKLPSSASIPSLKLLSKPRSILCSLRETDISWISFLNNFSKYVYFRS